MKIFYFSILIQFSLISLSTAQPISTERNEEIVLTFESNTTECNREQIIENYEKDYLGSNVTSAELAWNGIVDNCEEGSISDLAMERTLRRINYFRNLVGVQNEVIFNEVKNQKCQKAVLMMDAENKLDHYPTADWKCSSVEGIEAAGKSNLSYGGHSSASVPQYIRDAGSGNEAVGHRRWILYPKSYEFGFGSTNWGTAMWVIGGTKNPEIYPDFVAYPSPGYFPKNLIYPRWSFSKKGANYSEARIKMTDEEGGNIECSIEEITNGYGDNTLVWIPTINLYDINLGTDAYFKVEIDSIKSGGEYVRVEYEVLGIVPEMSTEPAVVISPTCGRSSGEIILENTTGFKNIKWSNGEQNKTKITGLVEGDYSVTITDKIGCERVLEFQLSSMNEPKILTEIQGSLGTFSNQEEIYSTDQFVDGNYNWSITNGEILNPTSNSEVTVIWAEGATVGTLCVQFSDFESCESNEICIEIQLSTSGIEKVKNPEIQLFPNPVRDNLNIIWDVNSNLQRITIYNSAGERISSYPIQNNEDLLRINIADYESGVYLLHLQYKDNHGIKKFVKLE